MTKSLIFARAFLAVLLAGTATAAAAQVDEESDWNATRSVGSTDAYFLYLQRYPRGQHVEEALDFLRQRNALLSGDISRPRSVKLY